MNLVEIIVRVSGDKDVRAKMDQTANASENAAKKSSSAWKTVGEHLKNVAAGIGIALASGPVLGMGAAVGGLGVAFAAFGALAAGSLDKVHKYLTQTGTAAQKTYAQLDPNQRSMAQSIQGMEAAFHKASVAFEPVTAGVLKLVGTLGRALLPAFTTMARGGANLITGVLKPMAALFQSNFMEHFATQMAALATNIAPDLGHSLAELLKALMELFIKAGPAGSHMLSGLIALLAVFIQNLGPFITFVSNVAVDIGKWAAQNKILFASLIVIGAAVTIATGGLNLIVPAILAIIAAITYLWRNSKTFRDGFTAVWTFIADNALRQVQLLVDGITMIGDVIFSVVSDIVHVARVAADAIGLHFLDGVDRMVSGAKASFDNFQQTTISMIAGWRRTIQNQLPIMRVKGDITDLQAKLALAQKSLNDPKLTADRKAKILADISNLTYQLALAKAKLQALQGYTVNTYVNTVPGPVRSRGMASGGITGAAVGGPRSGWTQTAEHGRELISMAPGVMSLPPGSRVWSNPDTESMMSRPGSRTLNLRLSFDKSADSALAAAILEMIRVEVLDHGGTVESALGSSY